MKITKLLFRSILFISFLSVLVACGNSGGTSNPSSSNDTSSEQEIAEFNYPEKQLNMIVAFGPGGGNDLISRTLADILQKYDIYGNNIVVENREGGSGAIGWSYVKNQEGNEYVATSTSGNFISTPLISDTDWNYADFTPVGLLAQDAMFLVVRADTEFDTVDKFVEVAKAERLIIGGTGAAGPSRVVAGLFAEEADIDFEYVPFNDAGQMVTALTSGSVDAIVSNPAEVGGQLTAGNLVALAFSAEKRNESYPDVPTFMEQGYEFSFALPRGIVLPPNVSTEVQEWWIDALKEAIEAPEWAEYLEQNGILGFNLWGDDFKEYLEQTNSDFERILRETGAIE
ncbi:Bug family tripartite tricarboxylate transporter substrate binding protein [Anaerobacillus sp. MEB173]|uniref:Bug family tripartite tricarboxylate transporter substrate binding protein n=1 Tax=Anaerobacillus sp. MEB173 TaxID=3383345 RepID=UPI003F936A9F